MDSNLCLVLLLLSLARALPASQAEGKDKPLGHKKLWLSKKPPAPQTTPLGIIKKLSALLRPPSRYPLTKLHLPTTPSSIRPPAPQSSYASSRPDPSPPAPNSTAGEGCVVGGGDEDLQGGLLKEGTSEALGGGVCGLRSCYKYGEKFVLEEEKCEVVIHNPNYTCLEFEDRDKPFPHCCPRLECRD